MKRAAWIVAAVLLGSAPAPAQDAKPPDAATLLFETPQFATTAPDATLVYGYHRTTADPSRYGPGFDDSITLHLSPGDAPDRRTVSMDLFKGPQHRAAGPFEDAATNPVLIVVLEHHVEDLARLVRANPRYLKNAIRAALRDHATVESAEASVGGRMVRGWRVTITPFADDPHKDRMMGLDTLTYAFTTAPDVPGRIVSIDIRAPRPDGPAALEETLVYDPDQKS